MDPENTANYLNLENREEAVRNLPRGRSLINAWDITPEGGPEGVFFKVVVWITPYYDELGKTQQGYAIRLMLRTSVIENLY